MLVVFLFCSVCVIADVWGIPDSAQPSLLNSYVNVDDNVKLRDVLQVLVQEELDRRLPTIVSDLQHQLVSRDNRIKFLERGLLQRNKAIDQLTSRVNSLETRCTNADTLCNVRKQDTSQSEESDTDAGQKTYQISEKNANYQRDHSKIILPKGHARANETDSVLSVPRSRRFFQATSTGDDVVNAVKVAFTAYLDHETAAMGPGQTIKMNRVLLNDGHGYNSFTGIFTAPQTGVYLFNFHFSTVRHITWITLAVDNVEQVDAVTMPYSEYDVMGSNTAVLRVKQGQSVWLEEHVAGGELHSGATLRFCTFSGVLLYTE